MPEIEILSSSDLEDVNAHPVERNEDEGEKLDPTKWHPAAWNSDSQVNGSVAFRHFEAFVNHPASVRSLKRDGKKASELKAQGNEKFKAGLYSEAVELYSDALDFCPDTDEFKYSAAVFLSNRAACFMSMGHYEDVIEDCTDALELDPKYLKAHIRRAQAYEKLDELESALSDWNKVLEVEPMLRKALVEQQRLDKIIKDRNEKLKNEMFDKLKGLGNTVLGKFGMSLDNFKAVQDPNTGSYSVSFQQ